MGQTLTHGVYLPDEGERNCYNGLAANWSILDGAVGTVADHTTALAGKAPLVHTHTKSDITDFPVYGNTAGTICEGNDSRLSDARTPVAHTHGNIANDGKLTNGNRAVITGSDKAITESSVTDTELGYVAGVTSAIQTQLNAKANDSDVVHKAGNETISGDKAFTQFIRNKSEVLEIGVIPSSNTDIGYRVADKNNTITANLQYTQYTSGNSQFALNLRTKDSNNNTVNKSVLLNTDQYGTWFNFRPSDNGSISLGSTNYRWSAVCSDSYYYGTTAWGLDKANIWSANNQFAKINTIETNTVEWHNSHCRGINLISTGHFANMAALLTAIRNQDWSDIYIGDYVELTFTYEGASRTVKFYVGEIDKFYKVGNTSLETHHLVMVTGDLGINQVMNDSNTTAGGYVGSKAHTVTLPALYAILNPLFNNAILTHKEHLSNTVLSAQTVSLSLDDGNGAVNYSCNNFPVYSNGDPNTPGCVTAGNWYDCNLVLMSEIEMFGSNRFASSGIDDVMCPEGQIAAFKYNRNLQTLNRTINTWLRNVNSASRFCLCHSYGNSYPRVASYAYLLLRPRFLIG